MHLWNEHKSEYILTTFFSEVDQPKGVVYTRAHKSNREITRKICRKLDVSILIGDQVEKAKKAKQAAATTIDTDIGKMKAASIYGNMSSLLSSC